MTISKWIILTFFALSLICYVTMYTTLEEKLNAVTINLIHYSIHSIITYILLDVFPEEDYALIGAKIFLFIILLVPIEKLQGEVNKLKEENKKLKDESDD